jgi:hypothetical protein
MRALTKFGHFWLKELYALLIYEDRGAVLLCDAYVEMATLRSDWWVNYTSQ